VTRLRRIAIWFALAWMLMASDGSAADMAKLTLLTTPDGIEFGVLGDKPTQPAPTLFGFASDIKTTLTDPKYNRVGLKLAEQGYLCVALDAPCHGNDNKEHLPNELEGWRQRLERGDDLLGQFNAKCTKVLDHLVAQGYTDPARVAVAGTSRGGFLALHFAAAEPRVQVAAAFAPVTVVRALREFNGIAGDAARAADAMNAVNVAEKLAGRPIWICIGNNDGRVGTDHAIALTRKLVELSRTANKSAQIELHVTATEGHSTRPTAHAEAAAFIAARMSK
jgi:dienelactone hydrolase